MTTDEQVRGRYCDGTYRQTGHTTDGSDFDAWLTRTRRDAAREALDGAADQLNNLAEAAAEEVVRHHRDTHYPEEAPVTVRNPYRIARDTVDAMLSDPDSASTVRSLLVELMEDALRLSMTPEWDLEDNCSVTEHVVTTLAPSLTDITRDEVLRAADQFGLEVDYLDDPYRGIALGEEAR